ncbi:MAG: hypothetical protein FJ302_08355 [Planctomycetes bacterium]|nr:hypothetical protein [Planctomycetota bacterium]
MTSSISIFGVLFKVLFVGVFFTVISGFWRMRGMANKFFTLAEQEMERKLREGLSKPASASTQLLIQQPAHIAAVD